MTNDEFDRKFDNYEFDEAYADYIMANANGDRVIRNGDTLTEAQEDLYLYEEFRASMVAA